MPWRSKIETKDVNNNKKFSLIVLERIQSPNEFKDNSVIYPKVQKLFAIFESIFGQK